MIIEIKLANYRSIHAEQTLSFVAERGTRHPQNLIKRPGYRLLKAAALFGANASGKSNFVRAIGEMRDFVRDSATKMNDGDPIVCAQPFRLDPESRDKPSRFEITFVTEGVQYVYGFAATRERVHEEWLRSKPEKGGKEIIHLMRRNDGNSVHGHWTIGGLPDSYLALLLTRTRGNGLFLTTAARESVTELIPAYRYLRDNINNIDMSQSIKWLIPHSAKSYKNGTNAGSQLTSLMRDADTGIRGITTITLLRDGGLDPYPAQIYSVHQDSVGNRVEFNFAEDESHGTQRLFAIAGIFLDILKAGAFLVIDELDASMHPLLTRRLLEMFQSEEANPNGAQLLFTTHDAILLDSALFRRDQIILTEKCDNESRFYSLADVVPPPRNTEVFLRNYLTGRFGGTPHLGPAFEMLSLGSKA